MMSKDEILQAFHYRHACKEFDAERKIPDDDFHLILESGRLSPSSFGTEPWQFVVIQNEEVREKLKEVSWGAQKQLLTSSHYVVMLARKSQDLKWDSDYLQHMLKDVHQKPDDVAELITGFIRNFQESDFKLLEHDRLLFEWACRQTYIALGNMMTVAAELGIDSSPIEGFDKEKVEQVLIDEGILDPQHFGVSVMVAFGYRIQDPRPKTRQSLDEVVKWVE